MIGGTNDEKKLSIRPNLVDRLQDVSNPESLYQIDKSY
jgi:hypothetical protein